MKLSHVLYFRHKYTDLSTQLYCIFTFWLSINQ